MSSWCHAAVWPATVSDHAVASTSSVRRDGPAGAAIRAADLAHLDAGLAATAHITDPAARAVAFLRYYEDGADELMSEQSGCLYAIVLAERDLTSSEINDQIAKATRVWRDAIVDLLRPALATRPGVDIDVHALADHLYTTAEGDFILCRTYSDPAATRAQLRIYRQLVQALLHAD